jgi:DNA topoisomerase-1
VDDVSNASRSNEPVASNEAALVAARAAGLRYVNDHRPGITRHRLGKEFEYRDPRGVIIKNRDELARIRAIAIPPAWTDVWICTDANGHIQATGRDARSRKQYRYHRRWRNIRDVTKYEHMLVFASCLPAVRRQVEADLARPGLPREKVLAAVVRLMERTLARVGNPEYARQNDSFGLTTLKTRHVRITRGQIELDFRAKSGIRHRSTVSDRKLARIVKNCRDLPGSELFQYVDDEGVRHRIDSGDVNEYLRTISGHEITAKDFRTWAATNLAFLALHELSEERPTKKGTLEAVKRVAEQLGNTPAVCRKSYIHPAVMECYLAGSLPLKPTIAHSDEVLGMWSVEREMIHFLKAEGRAANSRPSLEASLRASLRGSRTKGGEQRADRSIKS